MTNDECLICGNALEYLKVDETMECVFCHQIFSSKTRCKSGHFVCDECHTQGMADIIFCCLNETSKNPHEIIHKLMEMPFCHMHGPEHHIMVGSSLLTAYKMQAVISTLALLSWKCSPEAKKFRAASAVFGDHVGQL